MNTARKIWRVGYHAGNLFALVKATTPQRAIDIARAWRERKFGRHGGLSGAPPKSVLADTYTVRIATVRDIAWLARFGCKPYQGMPPVRLAKAPHSAVGSSGVPESHEAA